MIFESHRHDYDDMLGRESRLAGFSPKWIPFVGPFFALMLVALVYFVMWEVL
jgi:hypothetical protein